MLFLYLVFALGCAAMLVSGVVEQRKHDANLDRIPHRVLVNGIRGKSSITRLCAGALRGGGLVTAAKTTGTAARFIHPDGSEEPVYRKFGIANVIEQVGIVRRASAYHPDVLVVECMAVMPDLQEINQRKLIRSTIGVLCNVREDHLAEMGPTLDDVARSLSRSMPHGGICVTAEKERLPILQAEADKRDCRLIAVDPESVTDEEMSGFGWITFKENVAIALEVAELLGVNRRSALQGMWSAPPDPGVLAVSRHRAGDKLLRVANVFAANDPESTLMNIERLLAQQAIRRPLHLVINCRPDRVERNGQMGAIVAEVAPERIVLIGEPTRSARATIPPEYHHLITDLGTAPAEEVLAGIVAEVDEHASLVAVGNIHGSGELLLEVLERLPAAGDEEEPPAPRLRPNLDEPSTRRMTPVAPRQPRPATRPGPGTGPVPTRGQPGPPDRTGTHPTRAQRSESSGPRVDERATARRGDAGPAPRSPGRDRAATPHPGPEVPRGTTTRSGGEVPASGGPRTSRDVPAASGTGSSRNAPAASGTGSSRNAPAAGGARTAPATPARGRPAQPDRARSDQSPPDRPQTERARHDQPRPDRHQPERARAAASQHEQIRPDHIQPDRAQHDPARPDHARSERSQPDRARPGRAQLDPAQPDQSRHDRARPDHPRPDRPQAERARPVRSQLDQARPEPDRAEQADRPQTERARPDRSQPGRTRPEPDRPQAERARPGRPQPGQAQAEQADRADRADRAEREQAQPTRHQPTHHQPTRHQPGPPRTGPHPPRRTP